MPENVELSLNTKLRILTVIDPHGADKNPGARIGSYIEDFFSKWEQIKSLVIKYKINLLVVTGDLFSVKTSNRNSHELTSRLSEMFLGIGCPVVGVLGNHDMEAEQFDSWMTQPVGVLIRSGALKVLDWATYTFLLKGGYRVSIRGTSFKSEDNHGAFFDPRGDEDLLIHVSHSSVSPEGGVYSKYSEEMLSYKALSEAPPDVFILGHIHTDYGITKDYGKIFVQHGSLMRSTTHCYNLDRDIKVGLLEISKSSVTTKEIKLDISPSTEIFDLDKKKRIENEKADMESLINNLSSSMEESIISSRGKVDIETLINDIREEGIDPLALKKKYLYFMDKVAGR